MKRNKLDLKKSTLIFISIIVISLLLGIFIHHLLGFILMVVTNLLFFKQYHPRIKYITKRMGLMLISLLVIVTITFFLVMNMPGEIIPNAEKLTPENKELLMEQYGFDKPVIVQYFNYMKEVLLNGNFGISIIDKMPVMDKIAKALPISMILGFCSIIVGAVVGITFGLISALKKNTIFDYVATFLTVVGISVPSFVFATLIRQQFTIDLRIFPTSYNADPGLLALILPIIALSIFTIASLARYTRTEMLETLGSNYISLAKAKGVKSKVVIFKHGFKNALIPIITVLGPQIVAILTGSLVVERIFAIPGMGGILTTAALSKDVFMILGANIFLSLLFLGTNLIIDILYSIIDPRICLESE